MDNVFEDLIGKPTINAYGKIITVVAENFSFIEDRAKFLKATLAIPENKHLQLTGKSRRLVQIGALHREVETQLEKENWSIHRYNGPFSIDLCGKIRAELLGQGKSIIFISDASRLFLSCKDTKQSKLLGRKFLRLINDLKGEHFVVVLYQSSSPESVDTFLRDLEYISDACIRSKSFEECYFQSIWYQPHTDHSRYGSLLPSKVITQYVTCKIGVSYWSADQLQFFERREVTKNYDPKHDAKLDKTGDIDRKQLIRSDEEDEDGGGGASGPSGTLKKLNLFDTDDSDHTNTLPYTRAQNPEQSRIFYYPDKEDDIDEDDPDNDLDI